jgi:putative nucleotidyltransferase with HDIG domain
MFGSETRPLSPFQMLVFWAVLTVALVVALFPYFPRELGIHQGDIAARDLRSPRDKTFTSQILTTQAQDNAAKAVPNVLVFDPSLHAQQLAVLTAAVTSIDPVRQNATLSEEAKRARLLNIKDLGGLSRGSIDTVLSLPDDRWQRVQQEADQVLSDSLSRSIAPDAVQAERDGLLQRISPDLSADEANLVADLIRPLITSTLIVDDDATSQAREAARRNVQPVQQTIAKGQLIAQHGVPVDATTLELLKELGLLTPQVEWRNLAAVAIVAFLASSVIAVYLWRFPVRAVDSERNLLLLALMIALPVLVAKVYFSLVLPDESRRFLAYFLPLATVSMLIATLLEARLAVLIGLVQAALMMFAVLSLPGLSLAGTIGPLDVGRVFLVYGLGAVVGAFAVERAMRTNQYLIGGVLVSLVALGVLFALWLLEPERHAWDAVWMTVAGSVTGVSSGLLTAGGCSVVGALMGVTTRVQLMELSQLNAPLLRRLQDEAPGTFHHSVIVGNLAERATDLVGGDALLVRVGCYYHDIGKVLQPGFYIENQMGGANPHDTMEPGDSARIIAEHVVAGYELARSYRLPAAVQSFIPEHHGTRLIPYFFRKASQLDPKVDPDRFRYPGPKPQSRETAIVMLADSTEAMVRASADRSPERIDAIVEEVLAERLAEGELDECDLTLRDLRTVAESFKRTLLGVYHPRIEYPEPTEPERRALIGRFRPGRRLPAAPPSIEPLPQVPASTRGRRPT